ncbi:endonuclease VII domain-containing protein [Streptomyces sp. NPDC087300]|uniref:endonuclease VII domain-containing protein n=1 Tax=Streptomyces sp. NPDC087300 TaxID=3365780 RepID=UPI003822057B
MTTKDCEQCGTPFVRTGPARYCGDDCRTEVQAVQLTASMYALTVEQTKAVRAVQACMICDATASGFESGIFAVDHCHDTGVVRGALCQSCNFLLGNARDSVDVLLSAIKYLVKDHAAEPWNQGRSRDEETAERQESRLTARLSRTEKSLAASESRVKELEAILAEVAEDTALAARRRARDADALDRFIAERVTPTPPTDPRIPASTVRAAWSDWSGGTTCPVQSLHEALHKLGGTLRRTNTGRYWEGIGLREVTRVVD